MRQECRTDLFRLCRVLGHQDVSTPHLRIINHLQKFKGGKEPLDYIRVEDGAGYQPLCSMWELTGPRKSLTLVTRGGLKSTIETQAFVIQAILNYPDIRILVGSAQMGRAKDFIRNIKTPFIKNDLFRWLFPEYCPKVSATGKMEDFGDSESFIVPCRRKVTREPTVRAASSDSSVAGGHYEIVLVDDAVEDQNTRTPSSIEQTKKFIASLWPLVETSELAPGHGWFYLVGTIYSFSDPHHMIYESQQSKTAEEREWDVLHIPACSDYASCSSALDKVRAEKKTGNMIALAAAQGTLDELIQKHVWWPKRISIAALQAIERDPALGPAVLWPQYLLKPLQDKDGLITSKSDIRWIPRAVLDNLSPRISWNCTIDLNGMEPKTGGEIDYCCLNLHGWGTDGRCYFDKLRWGRMTPDQVIEEMFSLFAYKPQIVFFKIEKEAHSRVLLPFLRKAMAKRGIFLPVMELQRDNVTSKIHRIRGTQPYWQNAAFVFAEDIDSQARNQLELEALYFPKYNHDDILDTIADALQSRDGIVFDMEGRSAIEQFVDKPDYDGQERTWQGIPIQNLSAAALAGIKDDEPQYSSIFQGWN